MADRILDGGELLGAQRGADGALNLHRYRSIGLVFVKIFFITRNFYYQSPRLSSFFSVLSLSRAPGKAGSGVAAWFLLANRQVSLSGILSVLYRGLGSEAGIATDEAVQDRIRAKSEKGRNRG
jgi:hypothetical protein